jgi:F-box/leucine-rich repeat protein 2/20
MEVQLPLDEGFMETTELCLSMHTIFKAKGRSNSSPLPLSALDYVPVVSRDVFVPITLSRNLFDVVLPKELKLLILSLLVALHEDDQRKLLVQTDQWSVTKAISSKYRWLGKDKAARELVKLSRVNKSE